VSASVTEARSSSHSRRRPRMCSSQRRQSSTSQDGQAYGDHLISNVGELHTEAVTPTGDESVFLVGVDYRCTLVAPHSVFLSLSGAAPWPRSLLTPTFRKPRAAKDRAAWLAMHLRPMAKRNSDFLEVLVGQITENRNVNAVVNSLHHGHRVPSGPDRVFRLRQSSGDLAF
jgi:hypothetical protein